MHKWMSRVCCSTHGAQKLNSNGCPACVVPRISPETEHLCKTGCPAYVAPRMSPETENLCKSGCPAYVVPCVGPRNRTCMQWLEPWATTFCQPVLALSFMLKALGRHICLHPGGRASNAHGSGTRVVLDTVSVKYCVLGMPNVVQDTGFIECRFCPY